MSDYCQPQDLTSGWYAGNFAFNKMAAACISMNKKNWLLLIIILTAAMLIAIVFWIYAKRIEHIERKMIHTACIVSVPANPRHEL